MSDKKIKGVSISNDLLYERRKLADLLPLDTPLSIDFHASTFCNIKCVFCMHSSKNKCYDSIKNKILDFEVLKKTVDEIKLFPSKIKAIHFCGLGEPLINKNLAEMIKYVKQSNICDKVDINSNGILFNKEKTDQIISSGPDYIRISINGLSSEGFKEYTGADVDFEQYVKNLTYLYNNREKTKIYIKILNFMVDTKEKKEFFYKVFEPICDNIHIENYNECFLDTEGKEKIDKSNLTQRGESLDSQKCCPQPFFKIEILPDGRVVPCSEAQIPIVVGNVKDDSIVNIWNSSTWNKFRLKMLSGSEFAGKVCSDCVLTKLCSFSSDNIDSEINRLTTYYKSKI